MVYNNFIDIKEVGISMVILDKRGFTLLEAIASVFIITLILTTAITILFNVRNQTVATQERLAATEIAALIHDDIANDATYSSVLTWLAGSEKILTNATCSTSGSPFGCGIFGYSNGDTIYNDSVTVRLHAPTAESISYRVIRFTITIVYYSNQTIELEGILYDQTV